MDTRLALVTGCPSGVGRATALLLAERDWRVFACARDALALSDLAGESITPVRLDVTDATSSDRPVGGSLRRGDPRRVRDERLRALSVGAAGAPRMRAQRSGRIVNVSSINGWVTVPFTSLHWASKFAVEARSDALRMKPRPFACT